MQFEFSNIKTQYNNINADVIASITKENANAAKSNISSLYDSKNMNFDAAVLSISGEGNARINAMMSKSIQLRATVSNPSLETTERQEVNKELKELRKEIEELQREEHVDAVPEEETEINVEDAKKMVEESAENIIKYANDSIKTQNSNRESVLQLG